MLEEPGWRTEILVCLKHTTRGKAWSVFVRFAGFPLFWRLDLEVFARSIGRHDVNDMDATDLSEGKQYVAIASGASLIAFSPGP